MNSGKLLIQKSGFIKKNFWEQLVFIFASNFLYPSSISILEKLPAIINVDLTDFS